MSQETKCNELTVLWIRVYLWSLSQQERWSCSAYCSACLFPLGYHLNPMDSFNNIREVDSLRIYLFRVLRHFYSQLITDRPDLEFLHHCSTDDGQKWVVLLKIQVNTNKITASIAFLFKSQFSQQSRCFKSWPWCWIIWCLTASNVFFSCCFLSTVTSLFLVQIFSTDAFWLGFNFADLFRLPHWLSWFKLIKADSCGVKRKIETVCLVAQHSLFTVITI